MAEQSVNVVEIAGSHLPPYIKFDLAMGSDAAPYHAILGIMKEMVELGLITPRDASKVMEGPFWYWNILRFSERINRLTESNPEVVIGALSHLKQVKITDKGWESELKCEKVNRVRHDPFEWAKVCIECGKIDTGDCDLGKEFIEIARDASYKFGFDFHQCNVDTQWVDRLGQKIKFALAGYKANYDYPLVGYDEWKASHHKDKVQIVQDIIREESDNFAMQMIRIKNADVTSEITQQKPVVKTTRRKKRKVKKWWI